MLNIGPPELLLVLVIALVVVGPQKLPELARTIGRGLSEFRKVQDEVKDMVKLDLSMDPVTPPKTPRPTLHRTPRPATEADVAGETEPAATQPVGDPSTASAAEEAEPDTDTDADTPIPADPPASGE